MAWRGSQPRYDQEYCRMTVTSRPGTLVLLKTNILTILIGMVRQLNVGLGQEGYAGLI